MKKYILGFLVLFHISFANTQEQIVKIGKTVSMELLKSLKSELIKALSKNPYEAVAICNKKAIEITKQIESKFDNGIKIKRTSFKYRNPDNMPDEKEKEALKYFEKMFKKGKNLDYYIQKVKNGYRFYKPLKVKTVCLTCHGKNIDENLYKKIKQYYPDDRATGYKEGDFRGVIRIFIPESLIKKGQ